jgi:phosphate transport system protein
MTGKFHDEIKNLKDEVVAYGEFATAMLHDALKALKEQDIKLATEVNARKVDLASWSDDIEERALRLIALYQPMAQDLRAIACATRMNVSLYRIGRYGKDIAILVEDLSKEPHITNMLSIPHMGDLVLEMIGDVMRAYKSGDIVIIENIAERDNCVDNLRYSIFREAVSYMMEDPRTITKCTDFVMVARYLERCGDHACDMAEKVVYMVSGERVVYK